MNDLHQWCNSHDTSPDITEVIVKCLKAWQAGRRLPPYRGRDPLAYAYDAQHKIGWGCLLEGSLAKNWSTVQASYFTLMGSTKTASVWARGLIQGGFPFMTTPQFLATQRLESTASKGDY
jgi:hypothetical protein